MFRVALLVLLLLLGSSRDAIADEAEALWTQATQKMAGGQEGEAAQLLQELIANFPSHALADDALFLAASLLEEKLGEPAQAKELYQKLVQDYPDSRSSLAATRRLAKLQLALGEDASGAVPYTRFREILAQFPNRDEEQSIALALGLLRDFPEWPESYRVKLWIAETSRRRGNLELARQFFEDVKQSEVPPLAMVQASLGTADLEILDGNYVVASQLLEILSRDPGLLSGDRQAIGDLRARLKQSRERSRLVTISYVLVAAMLLLLLALIWRASGSPRAFLAALKRPPFELYYALPFALLFTFMAFTGHQEVGPAVVIISGGGLVVTWLSACALRSFQTLGVAQALLCGAAATIASLSLCYIALHYSHLLDLIATTLELGPE